MSATPQRQFDEAGNNAINEFFGIKESYTFEYSMKQAIQEGKLCQYYYYPHVVYLNSEEMQEYNELSVKLAKFYMDDSDRFKNDEILMAPEQSLQLLLSAGLPRGLRTSRDGTDVGLP